MPLRSFTRPLVAAILAGGLFLIPGGANADDIAELIDEARDAYAAGDLSGAKTALDFASQLIAQKNADGLSAFMPAPLPGWNADSIETDASAAAMFGGGLIARRSYHRNGSTVEIQIVADSPILMQMAPMFANPQMLGMMGRPFRVKGRTAVSTDSGIQIVIGRTLVTIDGSGTEEDRRAYLDALDFEAIDRFGS